MEKILIEWSDTYSVGIKLFDDHHKELIAMINSLYNAFLKGEANEKAVEIIEEMIAYTDFHFKTEEEYFDTYNYPATEEHKAIHRTFVDKVVSLKNELQEGSTPVSYDVMNYLRKWLIDHIMGVDKKYTSFFEENNIEVKEI